MSTILVVDDEASVRFLLRMIFETAGFDVIEAHHGAAALECVKNARPDLIVTDLMMPVMEGRQFIALLRSNPETASIPIVVTSAQLSIPSDAADAVLAKPFEPDALVETVSRLGAGA